MAYVDGEANAWHIFASENEDNSAENGTGI